MVINDLEYIKNIIYTFDFTDGFCGDDIYDYCYSLKEQNITIRHGISKAVLIPPPNKKYVIKIPFNKMDRYSFDFCRASIFNEIDNDEWDYCACENFLYNAAKLNNIEKAFPKTSFVGYINHWPIYIQEKCVTMYERPTRVSIKQRNKTLDFCHKKKLPIPLSSTWLTLFYNLYGEKSTETLLNFLSLFNIDQDLHSKNIGFSLNDNRPVILDFSDFKEEE